MKVKLLHPKAVSPSKGTAYSAGFDLSSVEQLIVRPGERDLISTGIAIELASGLFGKIEPRSGLAVDYGIDVMAGVIDSDYRGEIKVLLINHSPFDFDVEVGSRIAQLVIQPCCTPIIQTVYDLDETDRGDGGFGSTGK